MRAGLLLRRAGLAASGLELLVKLSFASEVTASCSSPRARASAVTENRTYHVIVRSPGAPPSRCLRTPHGSRV